MTQSTFRFKVSVPKRVRLGSDPRSSLSREDFYSWAWDRFGDSGLLGVHEGTLLSEQAAEAGFETDSWTLDAGEAPRERDWVSHQESETAEFYFDSPENAEAARAVLASEASLSPEAVEEQKPQDWDAEWKAAYKGASIPPFWEIVPPWEEPGSRRADATLIRLNPGAGFGTGTHETTQLCLQAVAEFAQARAQRRGTFTARGSWLEGARVLDFGSGSGILAFGAALLGATVDAVEIDGLAIDNAVENSRLNGIETHIQFSKTLTPAKGPYPLVIANILRPVLLEFAEELVSRLQPGGSVILSGLMEADVPSVMERYSALLGRKPAAVRSLNEWRALVWPETVSRS